jgi:hypothetical protein
MIQTTWTTITPEIAKKYLEKNTSNRTLRSSWVQTLAGAIENNDWKETHQSIAFSKSGRLLDGQHRLHAIVLANKSVQMYVTSDLEESSFQAIDCGLKRNISDLTGLPQKTAELCRFITYFLYRKRGGSTAAQVLKVAESGIAALANDLNNFCPSNRKIISSVPVKAGAIINILNGTDKDYVFHNYHNLVHFTFDELPPIQLNFLKQINSNNVSASEKTYYFSRSLKIFNPNNKDLTQLRVQDNEAIMLLDFARNVLNNYIGELK